MPGSAFPPRWVFNAATEAMETLSQGMTNADLTEAEELSREYLKTYGPAQENR